MSNTASEKLHSANPAEETEFLMTGQRQGTTGAAFIQTGEDATFFKRFAKRFIDDLKPVGAVENSFAELIAQDHYRLRRAQALEENTFALGHYNKAGNFEADHPQVHDTFTQARVFDFKGKLFQNLSLYEARISRRMLNHLKAFHDLQDRRKAEEREDARQATLTTQVPKTKAASAANGFGFSTSVTPAVEAAGSFPSTAETPPQFGQKAA